MFSRVIGASLLVLTGAGVASAATVEPFALPQMNGEANAVFDTEAHANSVFLIEGFQLRCGPCQENAPKVQALARYFSYEPRFVALDLGIDRQAQDYKQWMAQHPPVGPVLMDAKRELFAASAMSGRVTPTTWVLDCHLEVRWRHEGVWDDAAKKAAKQAIDGALEESCE
jgi:sugar/nucleoside kinase (ribokinase family)